MNLAKRRPCVCVGVCVCVCAGGRGASGPGIMEGPFLTPPTEEFAPMSLAAFNLWRARPWTIQTYGTHRMHVVDEMREVRQRFKRQGWAQIRRDKVNGGSTATSARATQEPETMLPEENIPAATSKRRRVGETPFGLSNDSVFGIGGCLPFGTYSLCAAA